jgi:DNA polymerase III epsilon subunit-like protein
MIVLAYDLETTGLDRKNDRMIEVGCVLYSTGQNKILETAGFLVKSDGVPISQEITGLTHITPEALERFGREPSQALMDIMSFMSDADVILGHNVNRFDKKVTWNTAGRLAIGLPDKLWVDTMTDLPVKGMKLSTMCAEAPYPFLISRAHSAPADAAATLDLAIQYGIEDAVERAKIPLVVIRSHQARGDEANKQARKLGFIWNGQLKIWWQAVKETDVDNLKAKCPFDISYLDKEISLEQLQD